MTIHTLTQKRGVTVVEVMVGIVIFSLVLIFVFHTLTIFFNSQKTALESTQAMYIAEEGYEIIRFLRDEDWAMFSGLSTDTEHYLEVATSTLAVGATPEVISGRFTRSFILQDAYRDSDSDFVASTTPGATVDSGSRIIIMRVNWAPDKQVELQALLTNVHDI